MSSEEGGNEERRLRRGGRVGMDALPPPHIGGSPVDLATPLSVKLESLGRGYTQRAVVIDQSILLLPADKNRKFLFVQNNDALGKVTLSFGVDAVLDIGMNLSANGGGILLDNNVPTGNIYAIGSIANNSNVVIVSA